MVAQVPAAEQQVMQASLVSSTKTHCVINAAWPRAGCLMQREAWQRRQATLPGCGMGLCRAVLRCASCPDWIPNGTALEKTQSPREQVSATHGLHGHEIGKRKAR
jgi:hypothetical protein